MLRKLATDAIEMTRASGPVNLRTVAQTVMFTDSFAVMVMTRVRESARKWHVPVLNRMLRLTQIALYGVEVGKDVELGPGVYLVHTVGTVIGGDARLGARVQLMGNNTIGTAKDNGYPVIEDDVVIGCGARILGPVRIGARARIGANAVVLRDVPADSVAVGAPASVKPRAEAPVVARPTLAVGKRSNGSSGEQS
jgi:serine O-acetyltransferase